jgi:hypothetical protein
MENLMSNMIDFFGKRINSPPIYKNLKIFLLSHEKVYNGYIFIFVLKNHSKNLKIMKKALFVFIVMMLIGIVSFSQQAIINGSNCSSAPNCFEYVCEGQNTVLVSGITSGVIDSAVWRQRYSDDLVNWSSWNIISSDLTIQAPFGGVAVEGRTYEYWLRIYQGGNEYWTFFQLRTNPTPISDIDSDYTEICSGEIVTFNASAGGTNYDFRINGISTQSDIISQFSTNLLNDDDTVTVVVTNSNGCSTTSSSIIMTVHDLPTVTSVTGNAVPACVGDYVNVEITGLTGSGPWQLEALNDAAGSPGTLYFDMGTVATPNATISVPVGMVGSDTKHLKITDSNGCKNIN